VLLPLQRRRSIAYEDPRPAYEGLVLIPAGPGIVRRIGKFGNLQHCKLGDVVEQDITIV